MRYRGSIIFYWHSASMHPAIMLFLRPKSPATSCYCSMEANVRVNGMRDGALGSSRRGRTTVRGECGSDGGFQGLIGRFPCRRTVPAMHSEPTCMLA
jgi:hypothetical protein